MNSIQRLTVYVCVIFAFSSCVPNANNIKRVQQLEEGVESPSTIDELTEAITKYQNRIEDIVISEERIGSWYKILASRYLDAKMYGKALESYRSAVEYYPTNHNLYFYIGVCAGYMAKAALDFEATGTRSERDRYLGLSESAYLQAIELNPTYARALYGLAVLYVFELEENQKAIPLLNQVLEIEKQNTDAMFVLGRAYYSIGDGDSAIKMYDRIIKSTTDTKKKAEAETNKKQVLEETYEKD